MGQVEIIAFIAQTALTYIFVNVATGNAQKQAVTDQKTDLRTTKEDLLAEIKITKETIMHEIDTTRQTIIESVKNETK